MKLDLGAGVVGADAVHWGFDAGGNVVLVLQSAVATVRVTMAPGEARDHGCSAVYLATEATLRNAAAQGGAANGAAPASPILGVDGLPLVRR